MIGIVCVGDSLINADKSWGYWLAQVTGEPLERVSVGGAKSADVLDQLPKLDGRRFEIACLTVGTNDVLFEWQPNVFEENLKAIVTALHEHAEQVVAQTLSLGLAYFPGSGFEIRRRVAVANEILRASDALVVTGSDLRGRRTMSPDRIHPSVAGQISLADRAAELLGISPLPSSLHDGSREFRELDYLRMGASQIPRRIMKRALGRPF